ncbi:MAG: rubrerythrin family protein [Candidatus Omnitrophota bacterium]
MNRVRARKRLGAFLLAGLMGITLSGMSVAAETNQENGPLELLMTAFRAESNAHVNAMAFAGKADQEGFGAVAGFFRAIARAAQVHFERHAEVIRQLGGEPAAVIDPAKVESTRDNLETMLNERMDGATAMYPDFLETAEAAGAEEAVDSFKDAMQAENVHADLCRKILDHEEAWKKGTKNFFVCPVCGNIKEAASSGTCAICKTDASAFIRVS